MICKHITWVWICRVMLRSECLTAERASGAVHLCPHHGLVRQAMGTPSKIQKVETERKRLLMPTKRQRSLRPPLRRRAFAERLLHAGVEVLGLQPNDGLPRSVRFDHDRDQEVDGRATSRKGCGGRVPLEHRGVRDATGWEGLSEDAQMCETRRREADGEGGALCARGGGGGERPSPHSHAGQRASLVIIATQCRVCLCQPVTPRRRWSSGSRAQECIKQAQTQTMKQ